MKIFIRVGAPFDAEPAIAVLCQSITQLCRADHQNDTVEIASWLSNKSAASWEAWLNREDAAVLVAECAGEILGVGMVDARGEILLNYVRPDARFKGISKALLRALESWAIGREIKKCFLESTLTAKQFYEANGYRPDPDASSSLYLWKQL